MKRSFLWLSANALLIFCAIAAQPPYPPKRATTSSISTKPATQQMLGAKLSLQSVNAQVGVLHMHFYSGLDYNTNHLVWIQSSTNAKSGFTNTPYYYHMGDSNVDIQLQSISNFYRFYQWGLNNTAGIN